MKPVSNVVGVCGSLRKGSYNRMLMKALPDLAPAGMSITEGPSSRELPLYDADIQGSTGFPAAVAALEQLAAFAASIERQGTKNRRS